MSTWYKSDQYHRGTYAQIDLTALKSNVQQLKKNCPEDLFFCPMVKANAYGHGDVPVVKALLEEECRCVGVVSVEEGRSLREQCDGRFDILVFGNFELWSFKLMVEHQLTPVISQWNDLKLLIEFGKKQKLQRLGVHLKFNTGMNRLGFSVDEAKSVYECVSQHRWIEIQGVMTHLMQSGDILNESGVSQMQLARFEKLSKVFPRSIPRHVYNSAALCALTLRSEKLCYGVRPGLAIYGVWPDIKGELGRELELKLEPVMSLRSRLVALHQIKKGEPVSYGPTWVAKRDSLIGVLPLGYADGWTRRLSNKTEVGVRGELAPQVGTICMDYSMIDLTDLKCSQNLCIGDEVLIFGKSNDGYLPVENCAKNSATIPYEILTAVGTRVPRVYVD